MRRTEMSAPLSLDLRNRAVEAYGSAEGTLDELAGRFNIGIATLGRWLRRLREHGDIAPAPHRGGMPARIPDEQLEALLALVAEKPDRTAEELRQEWQRRTNIPFESFGHGPCIAASRSVRQADVLSRKRAIPTGCHASTRRIPR